jgi:hypothetical protein
MTPLEIGDYVPAFIRDEILPNLPRQSGEGIHRALYDLARVLTPYRTVAEREAILRRYASQCERHVPENDRTATRHAAMARGVRLCGGAQGALTLRRSGSLSRMRRVLMRSGSFGGVRFALMNKIR